MIRYFHRVKTGINLFLLMCTLCHKTESICTVIQLNLKTE